MRSVRLRGTGRVELAAYGLADAEHRVEKELGALWPGSRVEVLEVARAGEGRIVEAFRVHYRVTGDLPAGAEADPVAAALRSLRTRFEGTRFERITLDVPGPRPST